MNFKDEAILLNKRVFKENSYIATFFCKDHGLYSAMVKDNRKKPNPAFLEGNLVDFDWKARLSNHLGFAKCELKNNFNYKIIASKNALLSFNSIRSLIEKCFYDRDANLSHTEFYVKLADFLGQIDTKDAKQLIIQYIFLELDLLKAAGFEIDLSSCVVTGQKENLIFVSPKSAKAVSGESGEAYADKLLKLPAFLLGLDENIVSENQLSLENISYEDLNNALILTEYFIQRYFFHNKDIPAERTHLLSHIKQLFSPDICFA